MKPYVSGRIVKQASLNASKGPACFSGVLKRSSVRKVGPCQLPSRILSGRQVVVASLGKSGDIDEPEGNNGWESQLDGTSSIDAEWKEFALSSQSCQQQYGWVKRFVPKPIPGVSKSIDDHWEFVEELTWVPPPSNLPVEHDESMDSRTVLSDLWTLTDRPGLDFFLADPKKFSQLSAVFVILFGVGQRETEGIYSLRAFTADGLPQETIIAFETEEDAERYAGLLEATMEHVPNVCSIPPRELLEFCIDQGYKCRLEPKGSLLIPPDFNVNVTDWERSLRLREGRFSVLPEEPDHSMAGNYSYSSRAVQMQTSNLTSRHNYNSFKLARYTALSDTELIFIRAKLERLLPKD